MKHVRQSSVQEWYSSELSIEVEDIAAIQKLCLLTEEENDALHQQCGIPACFLLPQYDNRSAKRFCVPLCLERRLKKYNGKDILEAFDRPQKSCGNF